MIPLIIFDSMHGSGIRNIFKACKCYRVPCARTKKKNKKRRILAFGRNLKKRGKMEENWSGVVSLKELPPPNLCSSGTSGHCLCTIKVGYYLSCVYLFLIAHLWT